jgi:hypothetical protein
MIDGFAVRHRVVPHVEFNGCPELAGDPTNFDKPVIRHFGDKKNEEDLRG